MSDPIDRCAHCGEPESAHHEFEAVIVTSTCRCDPTEWTGEMRGYGVWDWRKTNYHRHDITHQCGHSSRLLGHVSVTVSHETEAGAIQKWNEWTRVAT